MTPLLTFLAGIISVVFVFAGVYVTSRTSRKGKQTDERIAGDVNSVATLAAEREENRKVRAELEEATTKFRAQMDDMWRRISEVREAYEKQIAELTAAYEKQIADLRRRNQDLLTTISQGSTMGTSRDTGHAE